MAQVSLRLEKKLLREEMLTQGQGYGEIAAEFACRYGLRPRAAWREAHGWSLTEACTKINAFRGETGMDPNGQAAMNAPRLCEYEGWPGLGPAPRGRKPTQRTLAELAAIYGCRVTDLLDAADRQHLSGVDLFLTGAHDNSARSADRPPSAPQPPAPEAAQPCVVLILGTLPGRIILEMPGSAPS
jgi:hypothetical protein